MKLHIFLFVFISYLGFHIKPQIWIIDIAVIMVALRAKATNVDESVHVTESANIDESTIVAKSAIVDESVHVTESALRNTRTDKAAIIKKLVSNELFRRVCCAFAGFLCAIIAVNGAISLSHIQVDHEKTLGAYHFLMMGLNKERNGVYLGSDVDFSSSFDTKKERDAANLQVIGQRLADYKPSGILQLAARKMLTAYNDGTFAWTAEGNFFRENYSKGLIWLQVKLKSLYYPEGAYYNFFMDIQQMSWITVLFLSFFAILAKKSRTCLLLMLSITGLTFFELLFEVKARHLLAYTPIFIILATVGLKEIISFIVAHRNPKENGLKLKT